MPGRLILHDLPPDNAGRLLKPDAGADTVFAALPEGRACRGCFGCWVRTPGLCVTGDRLRGFPELIARHGELAVVSRLVWGGFSPAVKRVLDRALAHLLPFFVISEGVMRHEARSVRDLRLTAVFYGTGGDREAEALAGRLVAANAANIRASSWEARFTEGAPEAPLP
jgi:multimeric flavodoxin WrbA